MVRKILKTTWATGSKGFSLLEILVALLLIALFLAITIPSFRSLTRVQLKEAANQMVGLIRETYHKAVLSNQAHRIVYDFDKSEYWVEVSNEEVHLPQVEDNFEGGKLNIFGEEETPKKYAKPPEFIPLKEDDLGEKHKLPNHIRFYGFWADNMEERVREGQMALYFFPGGYTQRAQLTLSDGEDGKNVLTLITEPLTGEVVIENVEPEIEKQE